jgi:hypothetical protein
MSFATKKRVLSVLVLAGLAAMAVTGSACVGTTDVAGDDEGTGDDAIVASDAIARADEWVKAKLPYCQSANHHADGDGACSPVCNRQDNSAWDPYRSDCSGLVSWAWGLPPPGRVTWEFAPFLSDITETIAAIDLEPGDAVNNHEHVMLFKNWVTKGHEATFIEEPGCSSSEPYAHEFTSSVSISGSSIFISYNGASFTSIHYKSLTQEAPPPPNRSGAAHQVGRNADGRLEYFAITSAGALAHTWQTTPNGAWSGWSVLGKAGNGFTGSPEVAANADGRLEVSARDNAGALFHAWQSKPNAGWSNLVTYGGGDAGFSHSPRIGRNEDARLELFAPRGDGSVMHAWQTTANGAWSNFASLGKPGGGAMGSAAVATNHDGRLEVFVCANDHSLWHSWQTTAGGSWSDFAGIDTGTKSCVGTPDARGNHDGRVEVFMTGADGAVWHAWQTSAGGAWSDVARLGTLGGDAVSGVAVAGQDQDGRLEVFVNGTSGALWHAWQEKASTGPWTSFAKLGHAAGGFVNYPAVLENEDGRLEALEVKKNGSAWHVWQTAPNVGWTDGTGLGTP